MNYRPTTTKYSELTLSPAFPGHRLLRSLFNFSQLALPPDAQLLNAL